MVAKGEIPRGWRLRCIACEGEQDDRSSILCRACGGLLEFVGVVSYPTEDGLFGLPSRSSPCPWRPWGRGRPRWCEARTS